MFQMSVQIGMFFVIGNQAYIKRKWNNEQKLNQPKVWLALQA